MIREIEEEFDDDKSYWIGGRTNATENTTVTYFDYYPNSTGKEVITFINFKLQEL